MAEKLGDRLKHAWNAFRGTDYSSYYSGTSYSRPDRISLSVTTDMSIINAIYNRLALDAAGIDVRHVRVDQNGSYLEDINGSLNERFGVEANIDQTGRQLFHDIYLSMFDEGTVAIVPVETSINPTISASYNIHQLRVGKILEWMPKHVKIEVYNERTGQKEPMIVAKKVVGIVENPFYAVMNQSNSTLKRLIAKLNLLDVVDNASNSGKLDIIVQLPYAIKNKLKREEANKRMADMEAQLSGSKYGVAYMDSAEKITQLNRPAENNLMKQIEYLTSMLYGQLGLTEDIINGTADEETMLNYTSRTTEPAVRAVVEECERKFLTKTARTQGQRIMYFRDPFKLVGVTKIADIADKLTRNEIASSNEIRAILGWKPSADPSADELRNKNLNPSEFEDDPGYDEFDYEEEY